MEVSLPGLIRAFQGTKNKINKWNSESYLSQPLPPTGPGRPAIIGKQFATEIAFMFVLTKGGFGPRDAQHIAALWQQRMRRGEVFTNPVVLFPMGGGEMRRLKEFDKTFSASRENVEFPLSVERRPTALLIAINVPEIIERVNYLADLYARATSSDHPFDEVAERDRRRAINRGESN